jgi:hypothetical protein
VFFLQLSQFKRWLMRGPTDIERTLICRTLAGMHWSAHISYEGGKAVGVRWSDCGSEQPSSCLLPDEPTPSFEYTDDRFLRACGVRTADDLASIRASISAQSHPKPT